MRTGGGIFYASASGIGTGAGGFGVSGFQATTGIVTSLDGLTPVVRFADPYPNGFNLATGNRLGPATLLGQAIDFFDRGNRIPYSAQWNFNVQRELGAGSLVEIGYAASRRAPGSRGSGSMTAGRLKE